jgi:hypothetical protein
LSVPFYLLEVIGGVAGARAGRGAGEQRLAGGLGGVDRLGRVEADRAREAEVAAELRERPGVVELDDALRRQARGGHLLEKRARLDQLVPGRASPRRL